MAWKDDLVLTPETTCTCTHHLALHQAYTTDGQCDECACEAFVGDPSAPQSAQEEQDDGDA